MDITIDFATTRRIAAQEYARASEEISRLGPIEAYARSQERHDERLASAADGDTLACKAGCSWCCHFTIDVRAAEIFRILDYVETNFTSEAQSRLRDEIAANNARLQSLDDEQRMQVNIKCPFLLDGVCSIYSARPQTCRNYHATDVAGCRQSFEEPANLNIDPEFASLTYQIGGTHVDAFCKALHDLGYETSAYELNTGLAVALQQPLARARFLAKESPFQGLMGEEVPPQFLDDEI
jgi:Fe-S-cluster containining protein